MKVLAVIPARSGSKSVPHKNIRLIQGKPMMAYSIQQAKESQYINRIIVSTDSEEYAEIAREYGAETPFLRPAEYATDTALDFEVFHHCLTYLKEQEDYEPEVVVHLRPTYPIREVADIDAMIEMLLTDMEADSVRSMAPAQEIPYKMWFYHEETKTLEPIMKDIKECYNMPRQELPKIYYQNACIDVLRPRAVLEQNSMTGSKILGYPMKQNYDIDTEEEFARAEEKLWFREKKRFVFDIDGVIARFLPELDYEHALPNESMIEAINWLYEKGHTIVLFTARGYVTGKDWRSVTEEQMKRWGLHYHELHFGKPNADYYIDDKMLDMNKLIRIVRESEGSC